MKSGGNTMSSERIYDEEKIDHLIQNVSEVELCDLAEFFKVFGDSTRIKILYDLFEGEKNVTEICEDIEMNQSAVSHQLKALKTAKLVRSRREGKSIKYSLDDDHVKTIIAMGKEHIEE
jgi:ArsR family transcriptional regulator